MMFERKVWPYNTVLFVCQINAYFIAFAIIVCDAQYSHLTECFHTVTHYHSNPEVSQKSLPDFTYWNEENVNITFNISCNNDDVNIHLESVNLSLPAGDEDYCLESKNSSYKLCREENQCDCCDVPDKRCYKLVTDKYREYCDGNNTHCHITVQSDFLDDCPGREYDCGQRCHSRWTEVSYSCDFNHEYTTLVTLTEERYDVLTTPTPTIEGNSIFIN